MGIKQAAERAALGMLIDRILKNLNNNPHERDVQLLKLVDQVQGVMGGVYSQRRFDAVRNMIKDPDDKWMKFIHRMLDEINPNVLKTTLMSLGYQAIFCGTKETRKNRVKYQCNIPWLILMDPTSACNLKCTGCWAAEYGHKLNLTYDELDSVVRQGKKLGIYAYMFTGGEPLMRKKDIIKLCGSHSECAFHAFTNGTLVDEAFCKEMERVGNLSLSISLEGFETVNDDRRGPECFNKVMHAMDLLKASGQFYGTSICYTSKNYKTVTSDEFLDMIIDKGCWFSWYFHYMPVGNEASPDLLLNKEQREYMYYRIREIRGKKGGKQIFTMDFQNDGEFVGGCIAGGRNYCHINPNGDVEPCVFIHYSGANIREKSLLDCLRQPLFMEYRERQPFNDNMLKPCPMLENPGLLTEMVEKSGAHSTDLQSPESAEHLCAKCEPYAAQWSGMAEKLWEEHPYEKNGYKNYKDDNAPGTTPWK